MMHAVCAAKLILDAIVQLPKKFLDKVGQVALIRTDWLGDANALRFGRNYRNRQFCAGRRQQRQFDVGRADNAENNPQ